MLKKLHIQNLAVVEDVTLEFGSGLNVITGSTGAGKSLILGAVNLLIGGRAGADSIRAGEDKAVVECVFELPDAPGTEGGVFDLSREVRRNGRGRAAINGSQVTVKQLRERVASWIEPHGQNEQLRLRNPETHIGYLDVYAGNEDLLEAYREAYAAWSRARGELDAFERKIREVREKEELLRHRVEEIGRARLREGELEELENSIGLMENAEKILEAVRFVHQTVDDDEAGVARQLAACARRLDGLAALDDRLAALAGRLNEAEISISDCAADLRSYMDRFEFEPDRLEEFRGRRAYLFELERRYGKTIGEIIRAAGDWEKQLGEVEMADDERDLLGSRLDEAVKMLQKRADALTRARLKSAAALDRRMTRELEALMMPGARFRTVVRHEPDDGGPLRAGRSAVAATADGADVVRFRVRTNRGESEGPVDEIASTGEISRIALALKKTARAGARGVRKREPGGGVLIFDELDAGIGGDLGGLIANNLLELSADFQIICITHMPQIAAAGNRHLVVHKQSDGSRTTATVASVEGGEREAEIARMLGGIKGSRNRLALAAEMLAGKSGQL